MNYVVSQQSVGDYPIFAMFQILPKTFVDIRNLNADTLPVLGLWRQSSCKVQIDSGDKLGAQQHMVDS